MAEDREAELEDIREMVRKRFSPESIIEELGSGKKPRDAVLGAAVLLAGELAPALLDAVEHAAAGAELKERESALAFYGLHILGAARDVRTFPALMRILRLPLDRLDRFLGDALTETIKRVGVGVFNGRSEELYSLISDNRVDEYARLEMLNVMAFLAFEGRIELEEVKAFLVRFDDERLAPEQNMAWSGWETAIALLGFSDLVPRVEAARRDGRTAEGYQDLKHFFADLECAKTDWDNTERFKRMHHLGYIEDVVEELSWISDRDDNKDDDWRDLEWAGATRKAVAPVINPFRHVGRNDPCPCGSGKKAKRCCLSN